MSRHPFQSLVLLLAGFLLLAYGCTDGDGPVGPGQNSAVLGLIASFGDLQGVAGSQQINRLRVDVLDAATEESLIEGGGPVVDTVAPGAQVDTANVSVEFGGATSLDVIITVELLHVEGSTETVEWSSRTEVSISKDDPDPVPMPELGRGPLDNLAVTSVTIVDPQVTDLLAGQPLPLTAEVATEDPEASPIVFWSSLDATVATVDDQGVVTGHGDGVAGIVAMAGTVADTLQFAVRAPPTATITAPADSSLILQGTSVTFAGTAEDPEEGALPDTALVWTSDLDGVLGRGSSLTTSALSAGLHTVVLTATDSVGNSATASIAVEVGGPNTVSGTVFRSNDELGYDSVTVTLLSDGSPLDSTLTDGLGAYRFDSIAPGTYTVAVERADLPPFGSFTVGEEEQSATVGLDDVVSVDFGFRVPVVHLTLEAPTPSGIVGDTVPVTLTLEAPEVPEPLSGISGFIGGEGEGDASLLPGSATGSTWDALVVNDSTGDSLTYAGVSASGVDPASLVVFSFDLVFEAGGTIQPFTGLDELESIDSETGTTTDLLEFVVVTTTVPELTVTDPCDASPGAIAFGQTVSDALETPDCTAFRRHWDFHAFDLAQQGGAMITMSSAEFVPFTGATFPSGANIFGHQISGRADTTGTTTIAHILPAGSYEIFASSRAVGDTTGFIPHGSYSLSLEPFDGDLVGCQGSIAVAGGVSFGGMLESDDCVDTLAPDAADTTRYLDDYVVFLQGGETLDAEVVPDLDIRLSLWHNGEMLAFETAPAGGSAMVSVTAPSAGFYLFTPHSEHHQGTGSYTVHVRVSGTAATPVRAPGSSEPPGEAPRPPGRR